MLEKPLKNSQKLLFICLSLYCPLLMGVDIEVLSTPSEEHEKALYFSIEGKKLSEALIEFSIQSGQTLVVYTELVEPYSSTPVVGWMSAQHALNLLLSRSTLTFSKKNDNSFWVIEKRQHHENQGPNSKDQFESEPLIEEMLVGGNALGVSSELRKAIDIKKNAQGVVESVSASEIGGYPELNIADSLQRVAGVYIDRDNNEGSKITVRGYGPEFNLITYNGRQMPGSDIAATEAVATRSFDFNNLSSESVDHVKIYKTSRANIPSGGIGSTINIETVRPLSLPAHKAVVEVRALHDTSNKQDNEVTPEASALWSLRNDEKTWGILLSAAYQQRHSYSEHAQIANWSERIDGSSSSFLGDEDLINNGDPYWYPEQQSIILSDQKRTKKNGQLVVQLAPHSSLVSTIDYNYSSTYKQSLRNELELALGSNFPSEIVINENNTAVFANQTADLSYTGHNDNRENRNTSAGLNLQYTASPSLTFTLDTHYSLAQSQPRKHGNSAELNMTLFGENQSFDARGVDIPVMNFDSSDIDKIEYIPPIYIRAAVRGSFMETQIRQTQISGEWKASDDSVFTQVDFGFSKTEMNNHSRFNTTNFAGSSSAIDATNLDLYYQEGDLQSQGNNGILEEFYGGFSEVDIYHTIDFYPVLDRVQSAFEWGDFEPPADSDSDHSVKENTDSTYLQVHLKSQLMNKTINTVAGLRYESTSTYVSSAFYKPSAIVWSFPSLLETVFDDEISYTNLHNNYNFLLPNVDSNIELIDGLFARVSYSQTITRPDMLALRGLTVEQTGFEAQAGNPALKPYRSENTDLSLEWYYGDQNYLSLAYFKKHTRNFPLYRFQKQNLFGLTNPTLGPRAQAAREQITAAGFAITEERIWQEMINEHGMIYGEADDPLVEWLTYMPINAGELTLYGWEFSIQHLWGDTGFGGIFNAILLGGNLSENNELIDTQFSLPRINDSANIIAFYQSEAFQWRLSYHWRDTFLEQSGLQKHYMEAYDQLDIKMSYKVNDHLKLLLEGINITGSKQRRYADYEERMLSAEAFDARYSVGFRYTF